MLRATVTIALLAVLVSPAVAQDRLTYVYDAYGRLTGTTLVAASGPSTATQYGYDLADNRVLRQTNPVAPRANANRLLAGETLLPQQALASTDGRFTFGLETSGQLLWRFGATTQSVFQGTGEGLYLAMQADGNLVLYRPDNTVLFATNTGGNPGAYLVLQTDGNVVVLLGSTPLWASGTCCY